MLHEKIVDLAESLLQYGADDLVGRFAEQVPDGYDGLDAAGIVGKLDTSLKTILSAADSDKLRFVPTKILSDINGTLTNIKSDFDGGRAASQSVPRIMNLESFLWASRLLGGGDHAGVLVSDLGIVQETVDEARRTRDELQSVRRVVKEVVVEIEESRESLEQANEVKSSIDSLHSQASSASQQSRDALNKIKDFEQDAQAASLHAKAYSDNIETWASEVGELNEKAESSIATFDTSRDSFEEFLGEARDVYIEHMGHVRDLLQKATGASLFSAFEQKRKTFSKISFAWGALSIVSIVVSIIFAFWLVNSISSHEGTSGPEMWVKLSISPLFVLLIGFCSAQYARSKRTEDEYAFKSTLSLSLEPYRDLVSRMSDEEFQESQMEFVIEMIREIYSSPYDLKASNTNSKIEAKVDRRVSELVLDLAKQQIGAAKTDL